MLGKCTERSLKTSNGWLGAESRGTYNKYATAPSAAAKTISASETKWALRSVGVKRARAKQRMVATKPAIKKL